MGIQKELFLITYYFFTLHCKVGDIMDTQLMKGMLEGCILTLISHKETYGYELLVKLEEYGFENVGEGTFYPILTRLSKKGYLSCRQVKSEAGPYRKYYKITDEGLVYLEEFKHAYYKITGIVEKVLEDKE